MYMYSKQKNSSPLSQSHEAAIGMKCYTKTTYIKTVHTYAVYIYKHTERQTNRLVEDRQTNDEHIHKDTKKEAQGYKTDTQG